MSAAFAKGMTFTELSELTGTQLRSEQFDLRGEDIRLLRQIPGFESVDPARESLDMVKPIYGLQLLRAFGSTPLFSDAQRYIKVVFDKGARKTAMLLSTHVDDLKGCSTKAEADACVVFMEKSFGGMAQGCGKLTHIGIEHEQHSDGSSYQHQGAYAAQLRAFGIGEIKGRPDEEDVSEKLRSCYMSLLGGVAWMYLSVS